MHADPDGRSPRRIDAIIFSDAGTVTIEYADPVPEGITPVIDEGGRITVPYMLTEDISEAVTAVLESANDIIALGREADKRARARATD